MPEEKEIWEMNQREFLDYESAHRYKRSKLSLPGMEVLRAYEAVRDLKGRNTGPSIGETIGDGLREMRGLHVALALQDGKNVPEHVLADYPLLRKTPLASGVTNP